MAGDRDRDVTADEGRLWAHMMSDVTPLKPERLGGGYRNLRPVRDASRPAPTARRLDPRTVTALKREMAKETRATRKPRLPSPPEIPADKHLHQMDKRNALRLRKGQMRIDATLDLHGHSQAQAHGELNSFLGAAAGRGHRCILVITGKGLLQSRSAWDEDEGWDEETVGEGLKVERRGVLRRMLPRWLSESHNRALVVAWHPARGRHGGGGAFYVLLRRRRD